MVIQNSLEMNSNVYQVKGFFKKLTGKTRCVKTNLFYLIAKYQLLLDWVGGDSAWRGFWCWWCSVFLVWIWLHGFVWCVKVYWALWTGTFSMFARLHKNLTKNGLKTGKCIPLQVLEAEWGELVYKPIVAIKVRT